MANCIICNGKIGVFDGKVQILGYNHVCEECLARAGIPVGITTRLEKMLATEVRICLEKRNRILEIFTPTDAVERYIEVDENHRLIKVHGSAFREYHIVFIDEILGFDIVEDGMSVTKGGLGAAVAGGLLFGKTGAIAGATLGRKKSTDVCTSLDIIIILKDSYLENLTIHFIYGKTSRHSAEYVAAQQMAKKCMKLLERITGAPEEQSEAETESEEKNFSVADEILRFKQLLDDGIITPEEFSFQKKKLLGMLD